MNVSFSIFDGMSAHDVPSELVSPQLSWKLKTVSAHSFIFYIKAMKEESD